MDFNTKDATPEMILRTKMMICTMGGFSLAEMESSSFYDLEVEESNKPNEMEKASGLRYCVRYLEELKSDAHNMEKVEVAKIGVDLVVFEKVKRNNDVFIQEQLTMISNCIHMEGFEHRLTTSTFGNIAYIALYATNARLKWVANELFEIIQNKLNGVVDPPVMLGKSLSS
jgi:hypothetical protein